MGWYVAELDSRFRLDREEARAAVEAAATLWEAAVDRPLFPHDRAGVLPISFHYDERQADVQARQEAERTLHRLGEALDSARLEIKARQAEVTRDRDEHEARVDRLLARLDAYNREVERWNQGGGAPDTIRSRLSERAADLSREQRALQAEGRALSRRDASLSEDVQELNRRIQARNRRAGELTRAYSGRVSEAGRYDEQVETRMREVRVRRREIRIFRFEDRDDLVLVLAHELGHALGLGHVATPDAVMSTVIEGTPAQGLHPADLRLLDSTCPLLH